MPGDNFIIYSFKTEMVQRRQWTEFQDNALKYLKQECALKKWSEIAHKMQQMFGILDRNQKQCRDRYTNNLDPDLKPAGWDQKDEVHLIECHKRYGNKWKVLADQFRGRTDSFIKNHFYSRLRKSVRKINRSIDEQFKKRYKKLNLNIIFKLTNLVQNKICKVSQDVHQFYEKLMYDIIAFSLDSGDGQKNPQQIQTYVLALTSLQILSGTIKASRKPKRGRGTKKEDKYLISRSGLYLVVFDDLVVIKKESQLVQESTSKVSKTDRTQIFQDKIQKSITYQQIIFDTDNSKSTNNIVEQKYDSASQAQQHDQKQAPHIQLSKGLHTVEIIDQASKNKFRNQTNKSKNINCKTVFQKQVAQQKIQQQNSQAVYELEIANDVQLFMVLQNPQQNPSQSNMMEYISTFFSQILVQRHNFAEKDSILQLYQQKSFEIDHLF